MAASRRASAAARRGAPSSVALGMRIRSCIRCSFCSARSRGQPPVAHHADEEVGLGLQEGQRVGGLQDVSSRRPAGLVHADQRCDVGREGIGGALLAQPALADVGGALLVPFVVAVRARWRGRVERVVAGGERALDVVDHRRDLERLVGFGVEHEHPLARAREVARVGVDLVDPRERARDELGHGRLTTASPWPAGPPRRAPRAWPRRPWGGPRACRSRARRTRSRRWR